MGGLNCARAHKDPGTNNSANDREIVCGIYDGSTVTVYEKTCNLTLIGGTLM